MQWAYGVFLPPAEHPIVPCTDEALQSVLYVPPTDKLHSVVVVLVHVVVLLDGRTSLVPGIQYV